MVIRVAINGLGQWTLRLGFDGSDQAQHLAFVEPIDNDVSELWQTAMLQKWNSGSFERV